LQNSKKRDSNLISIPNPELKQKGRQSFREKWIRGFRIWREPFEIRNLTTSFFREIYFLLYCWSLFHNSYLISEIFFETKMKIAVWDRAFFSLERREKEQIWHVEEIYRINKEHFLFRKKLLKVVIENL